MTDYFQLPPVIKSLNHMGKGDLKNYLMRLEKLNDSQFFLDSLRSIYVKDKPTFFTIIDELALRGFYFSTEKPNNIIPSGAVSFENYIIAPEDHGRYRNLNLQKLGMTGFFHRFHVQGDTFFHLIPLAGFRRINNSVEISLLREELEQAGFTIAHWAEEKAEENNKPTGSMNELTEAHSENEAEHLIEIVFADHKYRTFREFCQKNSIQTIAEITDKHFEEYWYYPGVGSTKLDAVKSRVKYFQNKKSSDIGVQVSPNTAASGKVAIHEVFPEGIFRTFRDFCKKNKINSIHELTSLHYLNYSRTNGVGIGKVEAVKKRVAEYLPELKTQNAAANDNEKLLLVEEVFSENLFRSFLKYCKMKKIETVCALTEKDLEQYGEMRGVGVAKVEAVKQRLNKVIGLPTAPLKINSAAASIDISTFFIENKYKSFRNFCAEQGIQTVGEIQTHHLEVFKSLEGVGKKRYEEVKTALSHYIDSADPQPKYFESGAIYELIMDLPVSEVLSFFGYQSNTNPRLNMKEIEGKDIAQLKDEVEPHLLFDMSLRLKNIVHPKDVAANIKAMLTERDFDIVLHRYQNLETLEEIGTHVGVTRERIRQILKKQVRKISGYLGRNQFSTVIGLVSKSKSFVTKQELLDIIGTENGYLVNLIKQEQLQFQIYNNLDVFFFEGNGKIDFKAVDDFMNELPEIFHFYEHQPSFEELLESISIEEPTSELIQAMIEAGGYVRFGEVYSRHKLSMNEVFTYLFKHYIHGALRIDEEGVEILENLAKRHLDFEFGSSVRAIDARIRDAENVLLVDRSTFQYFDSKNFDTSLISEIEEYLNEGFSLKDVINVQEVYETFQPKLERLGIGTKLHLYSLIRYYLDDKYTIGQGNTLNIFKNEASKQSIEDRLVAYMKSHNGICTREELLEVIKPQYKVDLAISASFQILAWGNNQAILFEKLKFRKDEKRLLVNYFDQAFKKGFSTAGFMFKEMMFDQKLSAILRDKGIDEVNKLASIIKFFKPNVKGHSNFLYLDGYEFDSFEKVIAAHFTGETSRQEIRDFAFEYGYKEMMVSTFLKRLLDQGVFLEIDFDQLYPAAMLEIDEATLAEIKAYVDKEIGTQAYLSLSTLKGYRRKLPYIGHHWNPYLLKSVLQRCGYRQVKKLFTDYRYDMIIIVRDDSPIETLEDLIVYVLENEYQGNMHEISIYDYLMEKGIVRKQDHMYKKVLPYEIKQSEKLQFDEIGFVSLRQEMANGATARN